MNQNQYTIISSGRGVLGIGQLVTVHCYVFPNTIQKNNNSNNKYKNTNVKKESMLLLQTLRQ